ncbi:MAG TPA: hypothetical protein VF615_20810 [Longimicrobiaceae bacterium]
MRRTDMEGTEGRGTVAGSFARPVRALVLGAAALFTAACATTGATLNSGVGDRLLEHPPYAAGHGAVGGGGRLAHVPIAYQRGGSQEEIFDPAGGRGTPVAELLEEMNAYLDSLGASVRLAGPERGTRPDVYFGCEQNPAGECVADSRDVAVQGRPWMKLAVGRPSESWVAPVRTALDRSGAEGTLVITLEVGQYWTRQRNVLGQKEVRLGTGYDVPVPWLTSLDQPVSVLQLTGALVGRDGRAARIGAEGLVARRTSLLASSVGAQALIRDEDVESLRTRRRDDLPGRPLVWQAALRSLVAELTDDRRLAVR